MTVLGYFDCLKCVKRGRRYYSNLVFPCALNGDRAHADKENMYKNIQPFHEFPDWRF